MITFEDNVWRDSVCEITSEMKVRRNKFYNCKVTVSCGTNQLMNVRDCEFIDCTFIWGCTDDEKQQFLDLNEFNNLATL